MIASSSSDVAATGQSATITEMAPPSRSERALINALDEPALLVHGSAVVLANAAARSLFGQRLEGHDVRLAIRHPQALAQILARRPGDVELEGMVDPGRAWRLQIRSLEEGLVLIRMVDRSDAVAAEGMRTDFVPNASHELRTPRSTIGGYAETLADEYDLPAETRSRFGRTIRDEAQRMLRIIEDLMSLSRIQADRFVAPSDRVLLADVIRDSAANAGALHASSPCRIHVDVAEGLPPVRGDRGQLIQLFDNLISNAFRYGCDRPDASIQVIARRDDRGVTATVQDHGPGIRREHLPRLTERFYRVDPARSRESGGTGLGLAIVKHIVERHKGALEIKSTVGIGTSVTVRFPGLG